MSILRLATVLALAVVLVGCGSASPTAVESAVASAAARASIAVPAGTIPPKGSAGIVAPVPAGQTLTVLNGYDNPMPGGTCNKGYGHDHCTNQQYGLDLVPSKVDDLLVLAPITGKIAWTDVSSSGCIGIVPTAFPELNLTVCHLSGLRASGAVAAGTVLGLRRPDDPWIHMSLDVRKDANGPLPRSKWMVGVPFTGAFTIAGKDFPPASSPTLDLHKCASFASTTKASGNTAPLNPQPTVKTADLSACGVAAVTPTPTPRPTPTPVPAPVVATGELPRDCVAGACLMGLRGAAYTIRFSLTGGDISGKAVTKQWVSTPSCKYTYTSRTKLGGRYDPASRHLGGSGTIQDVFEITWRKSKNADCGWAAGGDSAAHPIEWSADVSADGKTIKGRIEGYPFKATLKPDE